MYEITENFVSRRIMDSIVLVPVGDMAARMNGMITLCDVGAQLWEMLMERPRDRGELISYIVEEYAIDEAVAAEDVDGLLQTALENGSLRVTTGRT